MSAYVVEDKTINRIVTWLSREVITNLSTLDHLAQKYNVDLVGSNWDNKLASAMFQLNCDGVNARYGEGEAQSFRPLNFTYKTEQYFSLVEVFKSLQCYTYQCCEGDIPETTLYQFFAEMENYLAVKIVTGLPAYDKATWG